jgi:hypothetical protein
MRTSVPFRRVKVFGETNEDVLLDEPLQKLDEALRPSRGVLPGFGGVIHTLTDKPHYLYLAQVDKNPDLLAGQPIDQGIGLLKIGITGNLVNRVGALNLSFPQTSAIRWGMRQQAKFANREQAAVAKQAFKDKAIQSHKAQSLGREFFLMDLNRAENLFNSLSIATGLNLIAR